MDAIFLHGVEEMGTKDVFKYFQEFGPGSVEWIDDTSCKYSVHTLHTVMLSDCFVNSSAKLNL